MPKNNPAGYGKKNKPVAKPDNKKKPVKKK